MVENNIRRDPAQRRSWLSGVVVGCALLLSFLVLAACAGPVSLYRAEPSTVLQWPRQTTGPKIVWVRSITSYQDAGITKGFWKRALELLTGADERRIVRPYGVLFDAAERLYVADRGVAGVHCMDTKLGRYTLIGATVESPLRTPIGLAEDGLGILYITDSTAAAVFRYDPADESLRRLPLKGMRRPTGIVYNKVNKFLYVVDTVANQVVCLDTAGHEQFRFGATGDEFEDFNHPTDISVDKLGQLYVTDALNYRIRVFSPRGIPLTRFGAAGDAAGDLNKPKGVALDSAGHIYVCDALLDVIQVFDAAGHLLNSFGGNGAGNGAFWMPSGIFIDSHDYIFVSDTFNQRIQVFRYLAGAEKPEPRAPVHPVTPETHPLPAKEKP